MRLVPADPSWGALAWQGSDGCLCSSPISSPPKDHPSLRLLHQLRHSLCFTFSLSILLSLICLVQPFFESSIYLQQQAGPANLQSLHILSALLYTKTIFSHVSLRSSSRAAGDLCVGPDFHVMQPSKFDLSSGSCSRDHVRDDFQHFYVRV